MLLAGLLGAQPAFAEGGGSLEQENGLLENLQVLFLLLGGIFFLVPVRRAGRAIRCVLVAGALLCLTCILRELDVEDLAVPQWVILLGSGTGRNLILAAGWVALGAYAVKSFMELKALLKPILCSRVGILLVIAALLLLAGESFDHDRIKVEQSLLFEEILETVGYAAVLLAAILSRSLTRLAGGAKPSA
jgi:hypothetical protein